MFPLGFAQGFDTSVDGLTLYQATNVENPTSTYNDFRASSIPLSVYRYEAARAVVNHVQVVNHVDASNGQKIGYIAEHQWTPASEF